ncbi:MAG: hypothetical protein ACR2KL_13195 [Nocardioidaceae bacterium]
MSSDPRTVSAYHRRLPYGERVGVQSLHDDELWPFEGDYAMQSLDDPVVPEPPRAGEPSGRPCLACADRERDVIWRDADWHVRAGGAERNPGLPIVAVLMPLAHYDAEDLPPALSTSFGPVMQRLMRAIGRIDGIGRVHMARWGDGGSHFHVWFLARPLGMMQMRGAMLAVWDDLLPPIPDELLATNLRTVASAMATEGGEAVGAGLP